MITKMSGNGFAETIRQLETALMARGVTMVARIDHAAAAAEAGLGLRPTRVLIFGNPKIGTLLMQHDQRIGLDLPLKILIWEDAKNKAWVGYEDPQLLAKRYGLEGQAEVISKMTALLESTTEISIAAPRSSP